MNPDILESTAPESSTDLQTGTELLDLERLRADVAAAGSPIPLLRAAIQRATEFLDDRYKQNLNINDIVTGRAWVIDEVLRLAWQAQNWPANDISLVAVGGYGRGELLPHADIVVLSLTRKGRKAN